MVLFYPVEVFTKVKQSFSCDTVDFVVTPPCDFLEGGAHKITCFPVGVYEAFDRVCKRGEPYEEQEYCRCRQCNHYLVKRRRDLHKSVHLVGHSEDCRENQQHRKSEQPVRLNENWVMALFPPPSARDGRKLTMLTHLKYFNQEHVGFLLCLASEEWRIQFSFP